MRKKFSVILLSLSLLLAACSSGSQSSELTTDQQVARDIAKDFCKGAWGHYEAIAEAARLDSQYTEYAEASFAFSQAAWESDLRIKSQAKLAVFCDSLK